ncbi:MAG: MFS transporter [Alphaproteobacteria bacterium]|nr:MFS transporter [Alphaproteobacteria bacterium]
MTAASRAAAPSLGRIMLLVLLPFGSGYFLSYLFRAVNAVVAPDLVRDIALSASGLGLLTAAYLFAFAAFQLPLGILLDRFGPRRVQAVLLVTAGTGALLFGLAESEVALIAARGMIGLGFAGGLMASFKAVAEWAPPGRMPLLNSWVMAFGGIGVIAASTPADLAVQSFGWRAVFLALAAVTALVAVVIWTVVPRRGEVRHAGGESLGRQLRALGTIYSDREFWRVVPIIAAMCGSHIAVQTLWAGPWLADVGGLERDAVAAVLTAMAVAFTVGILGSGALADWVRRFGYGPLSVMMAMGGLYVVAIVGLLWAPLDWMIPLWLLFAGTGQLGILGYPHVSEHFGAALAGRAGTAINLLVFGAAFALQYGIGAVLDRWPTADGHHPVEAYATALGGVLALLVVTFLWMLLQRPAPRR